MRIAQIKPFAHSEGAASVTRLEHLAALNLGASTGTSPTDMCRFKNCLQQPRSIQNG